VATNAAHQLVSTSLNGWVTGTTNRVTVTDDGDGTITLTGPQDINTTATPTFSGIVLTGFSGVLKATAGVVSGGALHSDLGGVTSDQHHNQVHALVGSDHTVSGLTAGNVLTALTPTTFGFAAPTGGSEDALLLDQSTEQHVVNGAPHFDAGVEIKAGQKLYFDGV
jgi:hypothetical protein